jgi:uncharacterized membrane protein YfcA
MDNFLLPFVCFSFTSSSLSKKPGYLSIVTRICAGRSRRRNVAGTTDFFVSARSKPALGLPSIFYSSKKPGYLSIVTRICTGRSRVRNEAGTTDCSPEGPYRPWAYQASFIVGIGDSVCGRGGGWGKAPVTTLTFVWCRG